MSENNQGNPRQTKRAHYLQHVPFEGLGYIEQWLVDHNYEITYTALYEYADFPAIKDIDLLVIMGGPMSVNDEADYAWLAAEKAFIKQVVEAGIPTLGICLGAQLIANTFGANIYPNTVNGVKVKEIGWLPIEGVNQPDTQNFQFPAQCNVFQWHGETFDLPQKATLLAKSAVCKNQAFQLGSAIGLQFHLETTPESAKAIVEHCGDELVIDVSDQSVSGEFIQSKEKILSAKEADYESMNHLMDDLLSYLASITP